MPPYSIFENLFKDNVNWYHEDDNVVKEEQTKQENKNRVKEWYEPNEEYSSCKLEYKIQPLVNPKNFIYDNEFELLYRLVMHSIDKSKRSNKAINQIEFLLRTDNIHDRLEVFNGKNQKQAILKEIERVRFLSGKTLEQEYVYKMFLRIVNRIFISDGEFREV